MTKRIVVHAGLPKTGTSYLQTCFVQNREWLAEQGVDYPALGQEFLLGHHNIVEMLKGHPVEAPLGSDLPDVLARLTSGPGDCTLLSSELFSFLGTDEVGLLRDALPDHEFLWVLYIRRRSALCVSRWKEAVKQGTGRTFPEYLTAQLLGDGADLHPELAIMAGGTALGVGALRVIVYDELIADGEDLFQHFLDRVLGIRPGASAPAAVGLRNVSWPTGLVETVRAVNAAAAHGATLAPGGRTFVEGIEDRMLHTDEGRALVGEVEALLEAKGEVLELDVLDCQWRNLDLEILKRCGAQVLNPRGELDLFCTEPSVELKTLRPSVLHGEIPVSRFAEVLAAHGAPDSSNP